MKNAIFFMLTLVMLTLTSCEVIGDIFSAGFYTALILVVIIAAIIIYFVTRMRRRR